MKKVLFLVVFLSTSIGFCLNGSGEYDRLDEAMRDIPRICREKGYGSRICNEVTQSLHVVRNELVAKINTGKREIFNGLNLIMEKMEKGLKVDDGAKKSSERSFKRWLADVKLINKKTKDMSAISSEKLVGFLGKLEENLKKIMFELRYLTIVE